MDTLVVSATADHSVTDGNPTWLTIRPGKTASLTPDPESRWTSNKASPFTCDYTGDGYPGGDKLPDKTGAAGCLLWFQMRPVSPQPPDVTKIEWSVASQGHWSPGETTKTFQGPDSYLFQINDDVLNDNGGAITLHVAFFVTGEEFAPQPSGLSHGEMGGT